MADALNGRVALITGGASGIGAAAVELFLREGASVVLADLNIEHALPDLDAGDRLRRVACDITNERSFKAAIALANDAFGGLDILFNNAGAGSDQQSIAEMDVDVWDATMALLVRGPMLGIKHAVPLMRARGGGSIINTASIAGMRAGISMPDYSVGKAAVIHLTTMAAAEFARDNIRINAICPGVIPTNSFAAHLQMPRDVLTSIMPAILDIFNDAQPIARAGRPEDIAQMALFLASDASRFMTGQAVAVDGGMLLDGPSSLDVMRPEGVAARMLAVRNEAMAALA